MSDELKIVIPVAPDDSRAAIAKFEKNLKKITNSAKNLPKIALDIDHGKTLANFKKQLNKIVSTLKLDKVPLDFGTPDTQKKKGSVSSMKAELLQLQIENTKLTNAEKQSTNTFIENSKKKIQAAKEDVELLKQKTKLTQEQTTALLAQDKAEKARAQNSLKGHENQAKVLKLEAKLVQELEKIKPNAKISLDSDIENAKKAVGEAVDKPSIESIKEAEVAMKRLDGVFEKAGVKGKNLFTHLDSKIRSFGSYIIGSGAVILLAQQISEGVRTIFDMDSALTTINMTMPMTGKQMETLGDKSIKMAKDMGLSVKEVMAAAQIYANMNTSMDKILEKARPTALLSTASGMSSSQSADLIQGTLYQFDIDETEENLMRIVDVVEKISASTGVEFQRSIQEISEGIKTNGAMAKEAGFSYEEYAASIANLVERTRKSGAEIANAQKMIFSRLGQNRGTEDAASEEDISKSETAYKKLEIQIRKTKDEFQEVPVILAELGAQWKGLSSVQKAEIAEVSAGKQSAIAHLSQVA